MGKLFKSHGREIRPNKYWQISKEDVEVIQAIKIGGQPQFSNELPNQTSQIDKFYEKYPDLRPSKEGK